MNGMTPMQMKGSKGQMVNAEELRVTPISEGYSEYKLGNGKILRVRVIVTEVYRLDEKDEMTGKDNYFIKSAPIVTVEEPQKK